ncbi:MAG: hypothetical protein ACFFCS_05205 [Candidatus Hodarchaeota archaeon]
MLTSVRYVGGGDRGRGGACCCGGRGAFTRSQRFQGCRGLEDGGDRVVSGNRRGVGKGRAEDVGLDDVKTSSLFINFLLPTSY